MIYKYFLPFGRSSCQFLENPLFWCTFRMALKPVLTFETLGLWRKWEPTTTTPYRAWVACISVELFLQGTASLISSFPELLEGNQWTLANVSWSFPSKSLFISFASYLVAFTFCSVAVFFSSLLRHFPVSQPCQAAVPSALPLWLLVAVSSIW